MSKISYKDAGVDIAAGNEAINLIKDAVKTTFAPNVISDLGGFAAMIDLKPLLTQYKHPVLVQSIDGVGTKTILAHMMDKYDTLGTDLLSASSNDILVTGAKPLTLLDYIASDKISPQIIAKIVGGIVKACRENDVSLVGGETAEMPNIYLSKETDVVGIVTGIVDKNKMITGHNIESGDIAIGLPSSGLHTNGYSLARKLLFDIGKYNIETKLPELTKTVGETLLEPHINYAKPILTALKTDINIKGMAHITGGGLLENIPRVLPNNCTLEIDTEAWATPPIFAIMQQLGKLDQHEMYRTFNMGIGFVLILPEESVHRFLQIAKRFSPVQIGHIIQGNNEVKLI